MNTGPYDPRGVANLILDIADSFDQSVTNLALQKLLYFAHGIHLMKRKRPLVSGYFEAWQYGPVHPTAYNCFKKCAEKQIEIRAEKQELITGKRQLVSAPNDPHIRQIITGILLSYGNLPASRLVHISHAKDAPWEYIVSKAQKSVAFGLRIPDNVIRERFVNHKVAVEATMPFGEPLEDTPFA